MARTLSENAKLDFLIKLEGLKHMIGRGDRGLAEKLGCSAKTVSNMRADPFSVSGKYILMVQALYNKENERRKL